MSFGNIEYGYYNYDEYDANNYDKKTVTKEEMEYYYNYDDGISRVNTIVPNWRYRDGICLRYIPKMKEIVVMDLIEYIHRNPFIFIRRNSNVSRFASRNATNIRKIIINNRPVSVRTVHIEVAAKYIEKNYGIVILKDFVDLINSVIENRIDRGRYVEDTDGCFYNRIKTCALWEVNPYDDGETNSLYKEINSTDANCKRQYEEYTGNKIDPRKLKHVMLKNTWDNQK